MHLIHVITKILRVWKILMHGWAHALAEFLETHMHTHTHTAAAAAEPVFVRLAAAV
jgi:hypothetical protein